MLTVLQKIERELPALLRCDTGWQSLLIDYHHPYVERVWRQYDSYRIMLHRIHPCESHEALLHAHPWPSAMRVIGGVYEMGIGFSATGTPQQLAATVQLPTGAAYEMVERDGWHSVRPIGAPSLSVMVTGMPWTIHQGPKSDKELKPLRTEVQREILTLFQSYYQ